MRGDRGFRVWLDTVEGRNGDGGELGDDWGDGGGGGGENEVTMGMGVVKMAVMVEMVTG